MTRRRQRCTRKRGKRSRSIREDHGTLDIQRQLPLQHPVHLRIIDICCGGRWESQDAATGLAPERLTPVYEQAPCLPAISFTTGGAYSGLDSYAGLHIRTVKLIRGIPIVTSILQPSARVSSLPSLAASPDQDSADDYPEIGGSTCGDLTEEGRLIVMVALTGGPSQHSSSRYHTIDRSEASNAQTPDDGMIWNLNPNFNAIRLKTIMESI
jgi:hypothetical protein